MASQERRNYYRINYPVALEYKVVSAEELARSQEPTQFDVSPYFSLQLMLAELEIQTQQLLTKVSEVHPNIAACQRVLNDKIEIIGKTLAECELAVDAGQITEVNLSEAGFSYLNPEPMEIGTHLALKLVFPESSMGILVYGEVVRSHPVDHEFDLGIKFLKMPERVRSTLARIIIQAQVKQRRLADEHLGQVPPPRHH